MLAKLRTLGETLAGKNADYLSFLIPERRNTYRRYFYVLALTALALLVRLVIAPRDGGIQYLTFFPAVALSAVIGGLWPGLFCALLGATLATYLFWPPYGTMSFDFQYDMLMSNTVFLFDALLVSVSIEAMHRYYYRFVDMLAEHQGVEAALRDSQRDLNRAQAVAHVGNWRLDIPSNEVRWSDENHRIFGIPKGMALTYESFLSAVHPEDRAYVDRAWQEGLHGAPRDIEHRLLVDGQVKWVRERAELEFGPQGELLGGFGTTEDITEKRLAAEALAERERAFRALADNVPDNIVRCDCAGRMLYLNRTLENMLGRPAAELIGKTAAENYPDGRFAALDEAMRRVGASGESADLEQAVPGPDGETRFHLIRIVAERGADGMPASVLAVGRDLTAQKKVEEELRLAASVFHSSAEGVLITDTDATILSVNPAFTEITGYAEHEALGRKPSLLRSDRHGAEFYRAMWDALSREGKWQGEIWNRRKDGEAYLEWLTINRIDDNRGMPVRYVSVFHDTTEMWRKDARIRHLAFHDALTGLPNRALMQDRLQHALERARREGGRMSVTFIDLDRFKAINDGLGHDIGDLLLQEVAARIHSRLRAMDTVARLGGDEFVVLMEDLHEAGECACLAQELLDEIARPMNLRGHVVEVGASMGMAFYPEDGADHLELMKRADMAMYAAKSAGRNTYRFFQQDMQEQTSQRLTMEMDLRHAIANGDLELHYQPRVIQATGKHLGVEALVRWRHATLGLLPPGEFIPLAEECGLILELGAWVLDEACRQSAVWQAGGRRIKIAVNVSARQLEVGDLVEQVSALALRHGIVPADLEIELTESTIMANPEHAAALLARLRQIGVTVAVDDFGTGYSSLAYLRRLPIDVLKIDRSFVMHADRDEEDMQIVKTILALGLALKLEVVAEGIETGSQADLLRSLGCKTAQGYFFSRPLPAQELDAWLDAAS